MQVSHWSTELPITELKICYRRTDERSPSLSEVALAKNIILLNSLQQNIFPNVLYYNL